MLVKLTGWLLFVYLHADILARYAGVFRARKVFASWLGEKWNWEGAGI